MTRVDCYYIRIKNGQIKTTKIHGVGIAYNVAKGMIYCQGIGLVSGMLAINPIVCMIGIGIGTGFVKAGIDFVKEEMKKDTKEPNNDDICVV